MAFEISRTDVWAGEIDIHPGALARQLEALRKAGVNLESAIVRPAAPLSSGGVLFVAPLVGPEQTRAAEKVGLRKTASIHAVRIAGPDRPGLLAEIARLLTDANLNIAGLSAASIADRGVHYFRFECAADAVRAVEVLTEKLI